MIDSNDVNDLIPTVKRAGIELVRRMKELGYDIGINSTYRDNEAQNALYALGRTEPGSVMTNVQGGESYHKYKLAFDIYQNKKGKEYDETVMDLAGRIGQEMGLEWSGSRTDFVDKSHFQWTDGLTLGALMAGERPGDKRLPWETKVEQQNEEAKAEAAIEVKVEIVDMQIDGVVYKVHRILHEDSHYILLKDFQQAGYEVKYLIPQKMPSVKK